MSSSSKVPLTETGNYSHKNTFYVDGKISNCSGTHLEHEAEEDDVDEEEDVDFNPFLKGSPSLEASSSLSSDIEVLDSGQMQDYNTGGAELGEEIVMQAAISFTGACEKETEITPTERVEMIRENETFYKENMDMDDEDAICKRTRARYSLASFTLDELETFLQETDDDDDLYNVDDEAEYRKFLAAVLQGGGDDSEIRQDNENMEDEDEENDADFEIELEEALESDLEENCRGGTQEDHGAGRRPETRLNRRQKASVKQKNRRLGQASRPLRPLLPNTPVASFPVLIPETAPQGLSISGHHGFVYGFTPQQLGQLHCLIHEHVQLLVQVFSLCVLDPSRQHIASQVNDLISETIQKRDQVTSGRRVPYPCFFFCPPGTHPSVQHKHTKSLTAACTFGSDCSFDEQRESFPGANKEKCGYATSGQVGCFQTSDSSLWVPFVDAPIVSVLDVAPLNLVGKYMDEVSIAVREYQRQRIQSACDTQLKKEPLFPYHSSQSFTEVDAEVSRGSTPPTDQPPKKTLAAALVERTKKQSIALVPKEISELAQRFLPLFNPALFPHKPPPGPVANRVLFTDSEDELLAMGLMEYNTDWKAIQQRFLPCKSKHQIFIRQKNRSSSKAPENPIKAVRRMKSSPLTEEEITRIQEGLKVFKLDWMSVWKFVVPYRDPSLLPRQWRVASGTQKSYKSSADKKERRRLYELNRRNCRPAVLASWQTSSEKEECQTDNVGGENNSGDDCMGNEDGAFVHEAFLADWRPVTSSVSLSLPLSNLLERRTSGLLPQGGSHVIQQTNSRFYESSTEPNQSVADTTLRHCKPQLCSRPYRSRRTNSARLVKLAPDLPPVNLPPSVRIMSQSAFRGYEDGKGKIVLPGQDANPGSSHLLKINDKVKNPFERSNVNQHHRESRVFRDKCVSGDNDQLDLRMHPLLFQSLGDGQLPYYPLSCAGSISSSSFGFLSQFQPQLNLSLLCNPHQANQTANRKETASAVGIDFHPLLQKADDVTSNSVTGHGLAQLPVNSESLRGSSALLQSQCGVVHAESRFENSLFGVSTLSSSPTEKANELDLDIHLSFTSRIEKAARSRDVSQHSRKASNLSTPGSGTTTETQAPKRSRHAPCEYSPSASVQNRICNNLDSGVDSMAISSDSISVYGINVGDQSHPGIVMEQEELSDSEEEIGEHVEFECEEMDDSEADGRSDCEQIMDLQNKEVSSITREVEVTAEGKETRSNRLCLSLNFGPQSCLPHNELESASLETTGIKRSAGENCPPSHPRRSRKKPPCVGKHFVDRVQHQEEKRPESDSCAIYTSKVPRKSVRRTSTSGSNTGRLRKLDSNLNTDVSGENSTNDVLR